MTSGADHYAEAEQLIKLIDSVVQYERSPEGHAIAAKAQVHATLALAAATEKATAFAHGIDTAGYGR